MSDFRLLVTLNAVGAVLLVIALLVSHFKSSEPGAPMNLEPYYDDDVLEGRKLDRVLGWVLICSAAMAVSIPLYWLKEPGRQAAAQEQYVEESEERGRRLFQPSGTYIESLGCAGCHGASGGGGTASLVIPEDLADPKGDKEKVTWQAPALNTVLLKFPPEQVAQIITYGRPGTPMPGWGLAGKGALNDQSVDDLVNYLKTIQLSPTKAKAMQTDLTVDLEKMSDEEILDMGAQLFGANCARCHTQGWSYDQPGEMGGGGQFGPNLTNGSTERQFPGDSGYDKHVTFVAEGSDFQQPYGTGGIGSGRMPGFASILTKEQIEAIVRYERSL